MFVIPSLFIVFSACAVLVDSSPQSDVGFPDESEDFPEGPADDDLGDRQGFRPRQAFRPQQGFRPRPGDNLRPPGGNFGPPDFSGNNFGPYNLPEGTFGSRIPGNSFRPQGAQPGNNFGSSIVQGNDFRPTNSRPGNDFRPVNNQRPNSNSQNGNDFRPTNSRPGNDFRPVNNQRPNSNSQNGNDFRPTNSRPGNDFRPVNNQSPNSNSQNGNDFRPSNMQGGNNFQNTGSQVQTPNRTSTTPSPAVTTTRIPPRDPTNRIVYTVSCPCQYTRQYSPVCGTDGQTYGNLGVLRCAQQCGTNVQIFLMGACVGNRG